MIKSLSDIEPIKKYLARIGAEERSLRTAVVKEVSGNYWKDIAVIYFSQDGSVKAPDEYAPNAQEAAEIKQAAIVHQWPSPSRIAGSFDLPDELKGKNSDDIYEFRDEEGNLVMLQERVSHSEGKAYIPWTFWSDGQWRKMEPEGKLPLWGIDQLKDNSTVFIHEGAKSARRIAELVKANTPEAKDALDAHPWGDELKNAAHLGWVGGALSPTRTDWSPISKMGVKRAYIVSDNDAPGRAAVPSISFQLRIPTFHIQFTNEWPSGFDLADDFPDKMFKEMGGNRYYIGPSFRSCMHPATWATDLVPNPKGKPTPILRDSFRSMWEYVEEVDMFVCIEMPEIVRSERVFNNINAAFTHSSNTGQLLVKNYEGRSTKLCYRPDEKGRIVTDRTTSAINLHSPSTVKAEKGDPQMFLDFLTYMFPNEHERREVMRWCATLVSQIGTRMEYGLLLVSETQGIGKTTLGSKILAPLVGYQNTGFPTEDDISTSQFNGWMANKRLVVIGEIYSGHSWKAYNRLKGCITDKDVEVNQKFMIPYRIENWVHVVACSNSRRALKVEESDRRWFYPKMTEVPWPREKFGALNEWLQSGGLQIIRYWADNFGDYVKEGERAPMTELKKDLIKSSTSESQQELMDLCGAIIEDDLKVGLPMKDIVGWLREKLKQRIYDTEYELRKSAKSVGMVPWPKRLKLSGQLQYVLLSPKFFIDNPDIENMTAQEQNDIIRAVVKHPAELMQDQM
jgi:hypothetical protein